MVVVECVLHHLLLKLGLFVQDRHDSRLSNTVGIDGCQSFVSELRSVLKEVFVAADDRPRAQPHMEVALTRSKTEANCILTDPVDWLNRVFL